MVKTKPAVTMRISSDGRPKTSGAITNARRKTSSGGSQTSNNDKRTASGNGNSARNRNSGEPRISVVRLTSSSGDKLRNKDVMQIKSAGIRN